MPARSDFWRPQDQILNDLIEKCIEQAHRRKWESGDLAAFYGGGLILMVLAVIIAVGTGNPPLALAVVVVLGAVGLMYTGLNTPPPTVDPLRILEVLGGPGNLPAGYLVYAGAWRAGLREYLADVSDRQLAVAARLCREHPGSVADLIRLVVAAEHHVNEHAYARSVSDVEVLRFAHKVTLEWAERAPIPMLQSS
ncbi:hypothetical protein [Actinoplanes regularis]|uniref:hypothetical protein n=1 Tax=Actinoplanes regularis TaxID=52697 RepID=UPI000B786A0E|nr:hypothetical protein [Actinoplanes regularis]GIE86017.1 hypothetical protein Are01nite_24970 [Actinoplanes regularis]